MGSYTELIYNFRVEFENYFVTSHIAPKVSIIVPAYNADEYAKTHHS